MEFNGLLSRRKLLQIGATGTGLSLLRPTLAADSPVWRTQPGQPLSSRSDRDASLNHLQRVNVGGDPLAPGAGTSSTPLEHLQGVLTPSDLHFERHHGGVPQIDQSQHELIIGGMVTRALKFKPSHLMAYPMQTHTLFIECSGNSWQNTRSTAMDQSAGELNGLVSCSEWTGVPLSILLEEAGIEDTANWVLAEGADASGHIRSIPMDKIRDDVLVAMYQNGEPLRPSQGYPMRLIVPGWEGNVSVKWLSRLLLTDQPAQSREETSKYTDLLKNGKAEQFTFPMHVKSVITSPSGKMRLQRRGVYEINGLAWVGEGHISRVEVSADSGKSWVDAEFQNATAKNGMVRFRIPWDWQGQDAILQSRAHSAQGEVQPTRDVAMQPYSPANIYHYNGIQSWKINNRGEVQNIYV